MSTDTFKKVYTELLPFYKETIFQMKTKAEELKAIFDKVNSREMAVAQTNLEQALMWATKAWVNESDKESQKS